MLDNLMLDIVLYVLGTIGLCQIMVESKIMEPVRNWFADPSFDFRPLFDYIWQSFSHPVIWITGIISQILSCPLCCGLWTGLFCILLIYPDLSWRQWLVGGFAGSFLSSMAATYKEYLEAKTIVSLPYDEDN